MRTSLVLTEKKLLCDWINSYVCFLFICLTVISCKKEETGSTETTAATSPCMVLSGYTGRDAVGALTGITDTTDWRLDDNWSQCEMNLFGGSTYNSNCIFGDTLLSMPEVYPNPTSDVLSFNLGVQVISNDTNLINAVNHNDSAIVVDLVLLNQHLQPVSTIHTNKYQLNRLQVSLNSVDSVPADTIFRIYYKLTDPANCVRTGHGDVIRH